MKEYLKHYIRKLLKRIFPELSLLEAEHFKRVVGGIIDESSFVSKKAKVYYPASIEQQSSIGDYSYLAINAHLRMVTVGKFCSIGPNFLAGYGVHPLEGISTSPMFYSTMAQNGTTLSHNNKIVEQKPIVIGNDVFIGANVTVLDGVTIGDGAVIGAGTVVSKDVPPYAIVVGAPIRILRYRFDDATIDKLLRLEWWNMPEDKLPLVEQYFWEVERLISKCSSECKN